MPYGSVLLCVFSGALLGGLVVVIGCSIRRAADSFRDSPTFAFFRWLSAVIELMVTRGRRGSDAARSEQQTQSLLHRDFYPGSMPSERSKARALELRMQGNEAFSADRFQDAVRLYGEALLCNPADHLVLSNRSACWLRLGRAVEALDDADMCVKLAPAFAKGWLRKGTAEALLMRKVDAQTSFKAGMRHDPQNKALQSSAREQADSSAGLQGTLYRVLFVSPDLQLNHLFSALEEPEGVTAAYIEEHRAQLDSQFQCLTETLHVDITVLLASAVLRDAFDRATFACGQVLQWQPQAVCRHLRQARRIVDGLGLAVRSGWLMHHGIAKFSANALVILATSSEADDGLRREAVRLLLGGMLRWLLDPTPEPEVLPEDREVCGCSFLSPRLSAATWMERLFEHGCRPWVREECERFPDIVLLSVHMCLVVRDDRAVPLGFPCLLRLPGVARQAMESTVVLDLFMAGGTHKGRRAVMPFAVPRGFAALAVGGRFALLLARGGRRSPDGTGPPVAPEGDSVVRSLAAEVAGWVVPRSDAAASYAPAAAPAPADAAADAGVPDTSGDEELARRMQAEFDAEARGQVHIEPDGTASRKAPLPAPAQRLGEWLMASLGYLVVFIDDDVLFATNSCAALRKLAAAVPDGVERFANGVWAGLPLLERLSALACRHTAALELLELLARHSHPTRLAMQSLAASLAEAPGPSIPGGMIDVHGPITSGGDTADLSDSEAEAEDGAPAAAPHAHDADASGELQAEWGEGESAPGSSEGESVFEDGAVPVVHAAAAAAQPAAAVVLDDSGVPSWVEHFAELSGELGPVPAAGTDMGNAAYDRLTVLPMVVLGHFEHRAAEVPVCGCLTLSDGDEVILRVPAVPAIWNPAFADAVESNMTVDDSNGLGTPEWAEGKAGSVVLLPRTMIRRMAAAAPNWASATRLAYEAGVRAVVVVNDLLDDGVSRPAFRMGLFGMPPPPIAAFMVCGDDGDRVRRAVRLSERPLQAAVSTVRWSAGPAEPVAPWPLTSKNKDVAQAWSLVETVHRAAPSDELGAVLDHLAVRMGVPEKRVWLIRRLQRYHRGGDAAVEELREPELAFVECDRSGDQLQQLREQLGNRTGLAAGDITGEFEVRFKDESSVGSAVMREWMDVVAKQAFLNPAHRLLVSYDNGASFFPDPAAPFINRGWRGDFELLGRLLGLAVWHQVTLDLPLNAWVCHQLLQYEPAEGGESADAEHLAQIDPDLHKHKVRWLLGTDVAELGFEMPFTDALCGPPSDPDAPAAEADEELPPLPEVVEERDALDGSAREAAPMRLRRFAETEIALVPGGANVVVTEGNKRDFVCALLDWRLRRSLRGPVDSMVQGMQAVLPHEVLCDARRMLTPEEVCGLLSGVREIDVADWQHNTRLAGGLTADSREVRWFWRAVRGWDAEGRSDLLGNLLQFATGSRRVPVGGFAQLVGFNGGKHLFTLSRGVHLVPTALPTAHACICTIDLPAWESFEAAKAKLLATVEAGHLRFDETTADGADGGAG